MKLRDYDIIIVNSSGGKDSVCALWEVVRLARLQGYPTDKIHVSHQELGRYEWEGTKNLVIRQAKEFNLKVHFSKRRNEDGYEETLLEYVKRRGKWPSKAQRYCTSDFKRVPGGRVVTKLTKDLGDCKVLHVFGFRGQESSSRAKKLVLSENKRLTSRRRLVYDWLPIHDWSTKKVWDTIKEKHLPYHKAYTLGMSRLSCVFCIIANFNSLVIAGKHNPALLDEYVALEKEIGHTFTTKFSLADVQEEIKKQLKQVA